MATLLIRGLDDAIKLRLRIRAASHSRSMEEEARAILREALTGGQTPPRNLAESIRSRIEPLGGVELEIPPRGPIPEPPGFE